MIGLSHIVLHATLCSNMARLSPQATMAVNVHMVDRTGRVTIDKPFRIARGDGYVKLLEFDVPNGIYRMQVQAPQFNCGVMDYIAVLPEHNRHVSETLVDGTPPQPTPMLLEGTAPPSFLYVAPTFVLLDKNKQCKQPVDDSEVLPSHMTVENDQDAYYIWLYSDPALVARGSVLIALRLSTATGEYHYIRLKIPFPVQWEGWPQAVQFDISEDEIDSLAGDPVDTLLCPKLFRTSVG